jgi:hypothetical protein
MNVKNGEKWAINTMENKIGHYIKKQVKIPEVFQTPPILRSEMPWNKGSSMIDDFNERK